MKSMYTVKMKGNNVYRKVKTNISKVRYNKTGRFFPAPGLCSLFARAKMLYRRLVDDVIEIFVLLHTSYFS